MSSIIPRDSIFDIDKVMNTFWSPLARGQDMNNVLMSPKVDIKENKDHFLITAELPGVKTEDLNITLENGILTVAAETRREDKEEKDGKVIRQERYYGSYSRSFSVGDAVNESDIEASFKDGVLTLKAKKVTPPAPQARRISVS